MGLFGFLKKSKSDALPVRREIPVNATPVVSPQELRQQLFDAAASGDNDKLCTLCRLHENSIFEQGIIWTKVPAEIRGNPTLLRWYGNGLKAIAGYCAEHLNKPYLMDRVSEIERQASTELTPDEVRRTRQRLDLPTDPQSEQGK